MLGRLKRTTRLDVGLAIAFAGLAYLVRALVAGVSRRVVQAMIDHTAPSADLPELTRAVKVFFVDSGFAIDLIGLAWLAVALVLVMYSSRQRLSISWVWVVSVCQSFVAALGAVLVSYAAYEPHMGGGEAVSGAESLGQSVSSISLPVIVVVAVVLWTTTLVWLLVERSRLNRRGPTLTDGLRTQVYR